MESHINFNELFPHFSRDLQNLIMEEVMRLLVKQARSNGTLRPAKAPARKTPVNGFRYWGEEGDGGTLAAVHRVYLINKALGTEKLRHDSGVGQVWTKLLESKNSTISYSGIASLCKGVKGWEGRQSYVIGYLWGRKFIDLGKSVAIAE